MEHSPDLGIALGMMEGLRQRSDDHELQVVEARAVPRDGMKEFFYGAPISGVYGHPMRGDLVPRDV